MLNTRSLRGARPRVLWLAILTAVVLTGLITGTARADAPDFVSSSGITVKATRWITERTLEADISTPLISPYAVIGQNRIRVTLPNGYLENPDRRYPVLYLLHGGGAGKASDWTTAGAEEPITSGKDLITVMPSGGKVGWYTNWVNELMGPQRWIDFYFKQVIPWVDANLRTIATKRGRAVAGLSMGGYGAVRMAQDRPDLFASVSSFSGAVDLGQWGTRLTVTEQSIQWGQPANGPFGIPVWPFDTVWNADDPVNRAARLRGLQVLIYAGAGTSDFDPIERVMQDSAKRFSRALTAAGVPYFMWLYGRPNNTQPYNCDGGHDWGCWNFALDDALPRILSVLTPATDGSAP